MTKENEVYKCSMCGNTVRVIAAGHGELTCCDQPMQVLESQQ